MRAVLTFLLLLLTILISGTSASAASNITAIFAFGDSTLDPGNNNAIVATVARADHAPYGRDFPGGVATGRFTNGRLVTDFLAAGLGIKALLPAYRGGVLTDRELATGVSFASAGSGLDGLTGANLNVAGIGQQVEDFRACKERMRRAVGAAEAERVVAGAVFIVGAGSNDMVLNYYPLPARKVEYGVNAYHGLLLGNLRDTIQRLYEMGGRKFAISGMPPIGCLPLTMTGGAFTSLPAVRLQRRCLPKENSDAMSYNTRLKQLIASMQRSFPSTRILYIDVYNPVLDMMQNPSKYGFTVTEVGCCGTGTVEMGPLCAAPILTCKDPSKFLFWDAVHPSETAYKATADQLLHSVLAQLA